MRAGTFSMAATNHQLRDQAELDQRHRRTAERRRREVQRSMQSMTTGGSSIASGEFDLDVVLEGSDSDLSSVRDRRDSTRSSFSDLDGLDAADGGARGALGARASSGPDAFGVFVPRASPTGSLGGGGASSADGDLGNGALSKEELEAFRVRRDKQKRREEEMERHNRRRARRVFGVAPPKKRKKRRRKRVVHVSYEEFYDAYELSDGQKKAKYTKAARMLQTWFRRKLRGALIVASIMEDEQRLRGRKKVKEILVYMLFLVCFSAVYIWTTEDQAIFFTGYNVQQQLVDQEFLQEHSFVRKTFTDVATIDDLYAWMLGPFFTTLYTASTLTPQDTTAAGSIFGTNYIIGGVRVSQARVRVLPCADVPDFKDASQFVCYGSNSDWDLDDEDTSPFGHGPRKFEWEGWPMVGSVNESATNMPLTEERDLFMATIVTKLHNRYNPGAYAVVLPNRGEATAKSMLESLVDGGYVDVQTRAMFIQFTTYNPVVSVYCYHTVVMEVVRGGGVVASSMFETVRLYTPFEQPFIWWLELCVVAFFVYFFAVEVLAARRAGCRGYLTKVSTVLHNSNLVAYVAMWAFRALSMHYAPPASSIDVSSNRFYVMGPAVSTRTTAVHLNSLNAFISWFKLTFYLSYVPQLGLVTGTLSRAAHSVGSFAAVFLCVLYGFAAAHMLTFGTRLMDYRDTKNAMYALITSLLGDFDFDQMQNTQRFLGPVYFVLFIGVAVLVVLNILIAIISDAHTEETEFVRHRKKLSLATEIAGYIKHTVNAAPVLGPCTRSSMRAVERAGESMRQRRIRWVNKVLESKRRLRSGSDGGDGSGGAGASPRHRYLPGNGTPKASSPSKRKGPVAFDSGRLQVNGILSPRANGVPPATAGQVVKPESHAGEPDAKRTPSVTIPAPSTPVVAGVVSPGHHRGRAHSPPSTPTHNAGGGSGTEASGSRDQYTTDHRSNGDGAPAGRRNGDAAVPISPASARSERSALHSVGSRSERPRPRHRQRNGGFDDIQASPAPRQAASARTRRSQSPRRRDMAGGSPTGRRRRMRAPTAVERARASARGEQHPHDARVIARVAQRVDAHIGDANDLFSMELARWNAK